METVTVHIINIDYVKKNFDTIKSLVSKERIKKAESFKYEEDQLRSLGAGYLIYKFLNNPEIKYKENRKPYIENGPYFNISHSGKYIVLVIHGSREIGVDIEEIDEKHIKTIKYVLSNEEQTDDLNTLFQLWSAKESLVKCNSKGVGDIRKSVGSPLNGKKIYENEEYYVQTMIYNGYSLSVTIKGNEPFEMKVEELTWEK